MFWAQNVKNKVGILAAHPSDQTGFWRQMNACLWAGRSILFSRNDSKSRVQKTCTPGLGQFDALEWRLWSDDYIACIVDCLWPCLVRAIFQQPNDEQKIAHQPRSIQGRIQPF